MKHPLPAHPERICILRLSALGDVCNLVPTLRALQRQWPQVHITWIIGQGEHSLLAGLPGVEFVVYDKRTGLAGMREIWRRLADTRFDALLHMQQSLRASVLSLGLKARVRIGYDRERSKDGQRWFTRHHIPPNPRAHVVDSFLDFARTLGVEDAIASTPEWRLPIPDEARNAARRLTGGNAYLLVTPCTSARANNFRNWTVEGYATVAEYAWVQYGLKTVLTGSGTTQEREMGARIAELAPAEAIIDTIGDASLKTLLALIDEARAVIAPDTGPAHMANALATPVIGLYATSNPDRTGPYRWRHLLVNRYPEALHHYLHKTVDDLPWGHRVRHPEAMALIHADDVIARLDSLLSEPIDEA
ncbi:glycosyltransferase family 9 protein [Litchfieldella xinjiangensis]|uniref:glycosyltransferase family 9 protein n=1 Tax=Litchfieldella xinjiangensis TaxID=1166948 RepID=UPI0005BC49E6|nr:glycosyltransferase family 9 protein [Halomonas xinjiangensis]